MIADITLNKKNSATAFPDCKIRIKVEYWHKWSNLTKKITCLTCNFSKNILI